MKRIIRIILLICLLVAAILALYFKGRAIFRTNAEYREYGNEPVISVKNTFQLSPSKIYKYVGESEDIKVEYLDSNDRVVNWYSEDEEIVTVNNGHITCLKEGNTRIMAVSSSNDVSLLDK